MNKQISKTAAIKQAQLLVGNLHRTHRGFGYYMYVPWDITKPCATTCVSRSVGYQAARKWRAALVANAALTLMGVDTYSIDRALNEAENMGVGNVKEIMKLAS